MSKISNSGDLGRAIRSRRKEKGWTQAQLADLSGTSLMFVSNLENGKETTQLEKAIRVANTVGLDIFVEGREAV